MRPRNARRELPEERKQKAEGKQLADFLDVQAALRSIPPKRGLKIRPGGGGAWAEPAGPPRGAAARGADAIAGMGRPARALLKQQFKVYGPNPKFELSAPAP